ncbi:MAG: class I SAM-dependent methyltransferase [Hyphomicrobiales bacterium]
MTEDNPDLDAAYALETPADNIALYRDWAVNYDSEFADTMGYQLPNHVARLFAQSGGHGLVLDVGAGTGLLVECLKEHPNTQFDALDISQEMLSAAESKELYRKTIVADLTKPLSLTDELYDAVVSSGTFTHGHVGPDALDELLTLAKPNALFVLSINAKHYESHGFAAKFAEMSDVICDFAIHTVDIYDGCKDASHQNDKGHVVVFNKRA